MLARPEYPENIKIELVPGTIDNPSAWVVKINGQIAFGPDSLRKCVEFIDSTLQEQKRQTG